MNKLKIAGVVFFLSLASSVILEVFQHGSGAVTGIITERDFEAMRLIMVYTVLYSVILLVFMSLFRFLSKLL